ncbi:hypothetical protein F4805DRAFT_251759 [Annulohypoxylon moriforme]|nr:hypothetical protein F4805DRAFT_251759 [Annulohypoxylon moriforme]
MTNDGFSTRIRSLLHKAARIKSSEHQATTTAISTEINVSSYGPTSTFLSCRKSSGMNNSWDQNFDLFNDQTVPIQALGPATPYTTYTHSYSQYMVPTSGVSKLLRRGDSHFIPRGTNARNSCTRQFSGQTRPSYLVLSEKERRKEKEEERGFTLLIGRQNCRSNHSHFYLPKKVFSFIIWPATKGPPHFSLTLATRSNGSPEHSHWSHMQPSQRDRLRLTCIHTEWDVSVHIIQDLPKNYFRGALGYERRRFTGYREPEFCIDIYTHGLRVSFLRSMKHLDDECLYAHCARLSRHGGMGYAKLGHPKC